jgi:hypothetical protein
MVALRFNFRHTLHNNLKGQLIQPTHCPNQTRIRSRRTISEPMQGIKLLALVVASRSEDIHRV